MNTVIYEKIKTILVDTLNISADEIKPESELVNDLGINSLELADLVFNCEETFEIDEIYEKSLSKFKTVADVVEYLEKVID